ncbi:MAG: acetamidase/formamidase family protein [bacterium]|nr:acetamidase/formamidase family protein [bacterium]MDE0288136.1 acetamidase/formamidase family protein [bacterium]MDE0438421.1 acetamidase/formamidase family protein [bacterium]
MIRRQGPSPLYYEASPTNRPTLSVEPGEPFEVVTQMNRGPDISAVPPDLRDEWSKHHSYEVERANPSSGAIWVCGAKPGMAIEVVIEDMELAPVGYAMFAGNNRLFPSTPVTASNLGAARVVRIRGDQVIWDRGLTMPARPMVGMMAVAPAHEAQSTVRVGHWGGNMDVQEVGPGATVRLVVNVPGALLHLGDVHAVQGDGEIGGTGVETSALLRLRVELIERAAGMIWPRIVTRDRIFAVAADRPAESAFRLAVSELIRWLHADYGLEPREAVLLLSQVLEARATQVVNPTITYVAGVRQELLRGLL